MDYYSLKMRASQQIGEGAQKREQHISGAERIVSREAVEAVCSAMARRALTHSKGDPDFINIKIEKVCEKDIQILKALPVTRVDVDSWQQGLDKAFELCHALKGVIGNLAITPLYEALSEMTEKLRSREEADYQFLYSKVIEIRSKFWKA